MLAPHDSLEEASTATSATGEVHHDALAPCREAATIPFPTGRLEEANELRAVFYQLLHLGCRVETYRYHEGTVSWSVGQLVFSARAC